eukprot:378363_1
MIMIWNLVSCIWFVTLFGQSSAFQFQCGVDDQLDPTCDSPPDNAATDNCQEPQWIIDAANTISNTFDFEIPEIIQNIMQMGSYLKQSDDAFEFTYISQGTCQGNNLALVASLDSCKLASSGATLGAKNSNTKPCGCVGNTGTKYYQNYKDYSCHKNANCNSFGGCYCLKRNLINAAQNTFDNMPIGIKTGDIIANSFETCNSLPLLKTNTSYYLYLTFDLNQAIITGADEGLVSLSINPLPICVIFRNCGTFDFEFGFFSEGGFVIPLPPPLANLVTFHGIAASTVGQLEVEPAIEIWFGIESLQTKTLPAQATKVTGNIWINLRISFPIKTGKGENKVADVSCDGQALVGVKINDEISLDGIAKGLAKWVNGDENFDISDNKYQFELYLEANCDMELDLEKIFKKKSMEGKSLGLSIVGNFYLYNALDSDSVDVINSINGEISADDLISAFFGDSAMAKIIQNIQLLPTITMNQFFRVSTDDGLMIHRKGSIKINFECNIGLLRDLLDAVSAALNTVCYGGYCDVIKAAVDVVKTFFDFVCGEKIFEIAIGINIEPDTVRVVGEITTIINNYEYKISTEDIEKVLCVGDSKQYELVGTWCSTNSQCQDHDVIGKDQGGTWCNTGATPSFGSMCIGKCEYKHKTLENCVGSTLRPEGDPQSCEENNCRCGKCADINGKLAGNYACATDDNCKSGTCEGRYTTIGCLGTCADFECTDHSQCVDQYKPICDDNNNCISGCVWIGDTTDWCRGSDTITLDVCSDNKHVNKGSVERFRVDSCPKNEMIWWCGGTQERMALNPKWTKLKVTYDHDGEILWQAWLCGLNDDDSAKTINVQHNAVIFLILLYLLELY